MTKMELRNRVLLFTLALVGLTCDQITKYSIFSWLYTVPGNRHVLFQTAPEGAIEVKGFALVAQFERDENFVVRQFDGGSPVPHVNHGALFGFLRDHKTLANLSFAGVSFLAAVAIIWWSRQKSTARDAWLCAALGLILGGTLGNLYDRLVFNGVRDFLHWDYLYDWPVFNIADCCLVCGAALLLLQAFAKQPASHSANPESKSASEAAPSEALLTATTPV